MTGVFGVVLGQILLMFLYLIIGYVLYRTGLITQEGSKALAHLLLYCVLPCVVLKSFCIEYSAKGAVELAVSIAAGAGVLLISMAVSWLFFRKDPMAQIGVAFSNAGFMGFPLVTAVLGGEAVFYAAGFVALLNALQWTYGQAKLSGDKKYIQLGAVLKNPLVLSLLGGVVIYFCRIPVPQFLRTPMGAIAGMNAPLAMIVLAILTIALDALGGTVVHMEHEKTGAQLIYLANEDVNRTFSIGFRTKYDNDNPIFFIRRFARNCPNTQKITIGRTHTSRKLTSGFISSCAILPNSHPASSSRFTRSGSSNVVVS